MTQRIGWAVKGIGNVNLDVKKGSRAASNDRGDKKKKKKSERRAGRSEGKRRPKMTAHRQEKASRPGLKKVALERSFPSANHVPAETSMRVSEGKSQGFSKESRPKNRYEREASLESGRRHKSFRRKGVDEDSRE